MNELREIAYRLDPVLWVREVVGTTPTPGRKPSCVHPAAHPFWR